MAWNEAILWVAGICGALLTILQLIQKLSRPISSLSERLTKLEKTVDENMMKLASDKHSIAAQEMVNGLLLESMVLLLEHGTAGEHAGDMERQAEKLKSFIFERSGKLK